MTTITKKQNPSKLKFLEHNMSEEEQWSYYQDLRGHGKKIAGNRYLAKLFLTNGDPTLIKQLQKETIIAMGIVIKQAYSGEINRQQYENRMVNDVSRKYAIELVSFKIATNVFSTPWINPYRDAAIAAIEGVVPYKTTGITLEEQLLICDVICPLSKTFFRDFHLAYGGPELQANPDIYHEDIYVEL